MTLSPDNLRAYATSRRECHKECHFDPKDVLALLDLLSAAEARLAAAESVVEAVTSHELSTISLRSPVFDALKAYNRAIAQEGKTDA
jgi:hypothetical protein